MPFTIRPYALDDFAALYKLDQQCFPAGISYSKRMLQYFLNLPSADCLVAADGKQIAGFVLSEENPPIAHIITLDIAEAYRRHGVGSALLHEMDEHFVFRGVQSVLLETSVENESGIAFWRHHGYRTEAVLKHYYLGRIDAYEMRKRLANTKSGTAGSR